MFNKFQIINNNNNFYSNLDKMLFKYYEYEWFKMLHIINFRFNNFFIDKETIGLISIILSKIVLGKYIFKIWVLFAGHPV